MRMSHGVVSYGGKEIEFLYTQVARKTMEIAVMPDQGVIVKAPLGTESEDIRRRVLKRARWIIRQQRFFRQFEPRTPGRSYLSGETHLYLGRHYRIRIRKGTHDEIKLVKGFLEIRVKGDNSSEKIRSMIDEWYGKRASERFVERLDYCLSCFKRPSLPRPSLKIRRLKKRWGSLSSKGMLTLNIELIRAPRECIDYVITHELCHLLFKDHSSRFYKFLEKVVPDWQERKSKLELALV